MNHAKCSTREESKEYLRSIYRNGQHLMGLINDILDLSKIEAGKMDINIEHCELVPLMADVASTMRVRADYRGNTFSVDYAGRMPSMILTDGMRLRQALINLAGNAIKFTERGNVRVVVRFLPDWRDGRPAVQFQVIDTGIGIRLEKLTQLFRPFVQAEGDTTRKFGGSGLGLAITKHIAELLGGDVTAESTIGKGSTFTLTVPAGDLTDAEMLSQPREVSDRRSHEPLTENALAGVHILLAEDGPDNQRLICIILGRAGANVQVAANGRIAVDRATAKLFDIILMDMQMPEMDGYEATRRLRGLGHTEPIIALTANAMSSDRDRCLAAGCDEFLTKPINHNLLIRTIAKHVAGKTGTADTRTATDQMPARDEHRIVSQYADDPAMTEALEEFLGGLPEHIEFMRVSLAARCHEKLRRRGHQLKGAGGSYGYPQLSEAAKELETAADNADDEAAGLAIGKLATLCQAIVRDAAERTKA